MAMPFYDLHVHSSLSIGEDTPEEIAEFAKRLGFAGIGIVTYYEGKAVELPKIEGIDIISSVIIKPSSVDELNALANKVRNHAEILMVHGGDYDINRAACENPMIDVLCHPELGRKDSGIDHICAKAAAENNVAIEINFREILESHKRHRVHVLSAMRKNAMLCRKYGAKAVSVSSAVTKWGMRSGRELAAVAYLLGMELGSAIATASDMPQEIVRINREKLAGNRWEGVSVVNG